MIMAQRKKNKKEKLFDEINSLYAKYVLFLGKENLESEFQTIKSKILIALYKVYVKIPESAKEAENKTEAVDYNTYADEILKISLDCLESFGKSDSNGKTSFSEYACSSIKRRLNFLKEKDSIERKNGSMKISEDTFKKAKKVKSLDDYYLKFGFKDEEKRNIKIADALETTVEKVKDLKILWTRTTVSQFQTNEDGKIFDVIDNKQEDSSRLEKFHNGYYLDPSKILEWKDQIGYLFETIQSELKEKIDSSSEEFSNFTRALTVDLCRKHFPHRLSSQKDGNDGRFEEERKIISEDITYILNMEKLFRNAGFLNSEILDRLFSDENYRLPEMQTLAFEAGYSDKSGLTKKLSRFYEGVIKAYEESGYEIEVAEKFLKA